MNVQNFWHFGYKQFLGLSQELSKQLFSFRSYIKWVLNRFVSTISIIVHGEVMQLDDFSKVLKHITRPKNVRLKTMNWAWTTLTTRTLLSITPTNQSDTMFTSGKKFCEQERRN